MQARSPGLFFIFVALLLIFCGCVAVAQRSEEAYQVYADEIFVERGDLALYADVYVPPGAGPFPAVLVIHGGGWTRGEKDDMTRFATRLAAAGFAAVNTSYRLAPTHMHPAQLEDIRAALHWVERQAPRFDMDPERIAVLGYSAGAHLALLAAVTQNEQSTPRIRAVVAGAGPTDLRGYEDSRYIKALLGGPPTGREHAYADASPVTHVSPDDPPVFIYHGRTDTLVRIEQAERMVTALQDAGVEVVFEKTLFGHALTYMLDAAVMRKAVSFLNDKLG